MHQVAVLPPLRRVNSAMRASACFMSRRITTPMVMIAPMQAPTTQPMTNWITTHSYRWAGLALSIAQPRQP